MNISNTLIVVFIIIISVFSIMGSVIFTVLFHYLENIMKDSTSNLISDTLEDISKFMHERHADMQILTDPEHPIMTSDNIGDKSFVLHTFETSSRSYLSFSIYDNNGKKILDTRNIGLNETVSDEEFFNIAMQGKIFQDQIPIFSKELNENVIRLSGPVYDQNKKISGVLLANIPTFQLYTIVNEHFPTSQADVISKNNIIIFSNYNRTSISTPINIPILQKNQYEDKEFFIFTNIAKTDDYPDLQWSLLVKINKDDFYKEAYAQRDIFIIVSLLVILGSIMFSVLFSRHITTGIFALKNTVKQMESGNYTETKLEGPKEIKDLILAFNNMSNSIKDYVRELSELNVLVNNAVEVSITDPDGNITHVNDRFCNLSKYSRQEIIGKNHRILKSGAHPDEFYKNMWDTIKAGKMWSGEIKNISKDGDYYWVKTTIMPFKDNSGKIYQYMSLRTDITKEKTIQENLYKALEQIKKNEFLIREQLIEIQQIDKQKDEFASMVSHELKTPLLPILGYCEILSNPELNKNLTSDQKDSILEITNSAEHLNIIIQDVLDAQKLEMSKMTLNYTSFDVYTLLDCIIKSFLPVATKKNISLEIEDDINCIINCDRSRLRQVFDNLIKNSIDFVSRDTGWIHVGAYDKGNEILFYVQDNGIGIPEEEQKKIFKKFYQVDTSHTRIHGGTGLGLVICKGLIEAMKGTIWVESTSRSGTTFYFIIPKNLKMIQNE